MDEKMRQAGFTKNTSYEVFMLGVSLLSFINLFLLLVLNSNDTIHVVLLIDKIMALLFFVDFVRRFVGADSKTEYFLRQFGWSDLLAAMPFAAFNIFRVFRITRFISFMRRTGFRRVGRMLFKEMANTALYAVFFLILLLLEFGSIAVLVAERGSPEANIKNASDALWWVFVSITTVGYGDCFPVTDAGRVVGVITLTVGVGLFGVVTGYVANAFMGQGKKNDS